MDLNQQALTVLALAILAPATAAHLWRPRELAQIVAAHGVLPRRGRAAAGLVVAGEVVAVVVVAAALVTGAPRPAGVILVAAGAGFLGYVLLLLRRGYHGDCGCSPLTTSVTRLSLLPGATLLAAGALLLLGDYDDVAFAPAPGGTEQAAVLLAATTLGLLVSLVPASALVGDPRTFGEA